MYVVACVRRIVEIPLIVSAAWFKWLGLMKLTSQRRPAMIRVITEVPPKKTKSVAAGNAPIPISLANLIWKKIDEDGFLLERKTLCIKRK